MKWMWALVTVGLVAPAVPSEGGPPAYLLALRTGLAVQPVNSAIMTKLNAAGLPFAGRALSYEATSVRGVYAGKEQAPSIDYRLISPSPQPGLSEVLTGDDGASDHGPPTYSWSVSFHGIEAVHGEFRQVGRATPINQSDLNSIEFRGDWRRMSVGGLFGWTSDTTFTDFLHDRTSHVVTDTDCRVTSEERASKVFPNLVGAAKVVSCTQTKNTLNTKNGVTYHQTGYYLQAYGWFIEVATEPNDFYYSRSTIVEMR
jgi:hypothetical protein